MTSELENINKMFGKEQALAIDKDELFAYRYALQFDFCTKEELVAIKSCLLQAAKWGKNAK